MNRFWLMCLHSFVDAMLEQLSPILAVGLRLYREIASLIKHWSVLTASRLGQVFLVVIMITIGFCLRQFYFLIKEEFTPNYNEVDYYYA